MRHSPYDKVRVQPSSSADVYGHNNVIISSGLANKKTVTTQVAGKDQSVLLATTKTSKQNKPAAALHKSVMKKEFQCLAKAARNQVSDNHYRPDLKSAALARLSIVHRSLKVAKSGARRRIGKLEKPCVERTKC